MGKITINEIHKSIFDYVQTISDDRLETKNKTIVGAINELISNNNNDTELNNLINEISNGKQLIANAIGEPLNAEDTFTEMSTDINGLLSQFKTNMMNNGVTVESSDKFKSLIDKIATMVDEGNGKGIQFAEGSSDVTVGMSESKTIAEDIGFVPTIAFAVIDLLEHGVNYNFRNFNNAVISSCATTKYSANDSTIQLIISNESLQIKTTSNNASNATGFQIYSNNHIQWYAIGVGEEDTTLNSGLDIISATELPATGRENQICVITDNPDNKIVFVTNLNDIDHSTNNIYIYLGTSEANTYNTGKTYECDSGNFTFKLYIVKIYQNSKNLASYIYKNGTWVEYTYDYVYFIENGALTNSEIFGELYGGDAMVETSTAVYICSPKDSGGYPYHIGTTNKKIDFSLYNYIEVVGYHMSSSEAITMMCYDSPRNGHYGSYISPMHYADPVGSFTTTSSVQIYDIRSWTSTGYLGFECTTQEGNHYIYITDVRLR